MTSTNTEILDEVWYLTRPNTRRLATARINTIRQDGAPRLALEDASEEQPANSITFCATNADEWAVLWEREWPRPEAGLARFGTWARYRQEVTIARCLIAALGWTLTPEEQAIFDALDEHGEQAPTRRASAA